MKKMTIKSDKIKKESLEKAVKELNELVNPDMQMDTAIVEKDGAFEINVSARRKGYPAPTITREEFLKAMYKKED